MLDVARDGGPISPEIDQAAAQAAVSLAELAGEFERDDVSDYAGEDTNGDSLDDRPAADDAPHLH